MIIGPLQESDASWSLRRCLATVFCGLGGWLLDRGFQHIDKGWIAFIPGGICVLATLFLLFFTTWSDITELVSAITGKKSQGG
jgi:hypothetical protein